MKTLLFGIDFGSSNTIVSVFDKENNSKGFIENNGNIFIPTKIYINDCIKIGWEIDNEDNKYILSNFKRYLGNEQIWYKSQNLPYSDSGIETLFGNITINDLYFLYFSYIKKLINQKYPNYALKGIISVPSNFNDGQRNFIKSICSKLEMDILRIINEPTVAAVEYGDQINYETNFDNQVIVFDMGAGTLDISLLSLDKGMYIVEKTDGDQHYGGYDYTIALYELIREKYDLCEDKKLLEICEMEKKKLDTENEINIIHENNNFIITQKEYHTKIELLNDKCKNIIQSFDKNNNVILVGNGSKLPKIKELLKEHFGSIPNEVNNLDTIVSEGCLKQAINIYYSNSELILVDCLPLSIGVETYDSLLSIIVERNTIIPITKKKKYHLLTDNTDLVIKLFQGDRPIASDNFYLGEFLIKKEDIVITSVNPIIELGITVDVNCFIKCSLTNLADNSNFSWTIKNQLEVNDDRINELIEIYEKNKESDIIKVKKITYTHELENIINTLEDKYEMLSTKIKEEVTKIISNIKDNLNNMSISEIYQNIVVLRDNYLLLVNCNDNEVNETIDFREELFEKINETINKMKEYELDDDFLDYLNDLGKTINEKSNSELEEIAKTLLELYENIDNSPKNEYLKIIHFLKTSIIDSDNISSRNNEILKNHLQYIIDTLPESCCWEEKIDDLNKFCNDLEMT